MQLLGQNEGGHQVEGSPRSVSEGEGGPVSPGSSPGSPTSKGNAPREKPVKVLPCPRCESMNTKFCYYNNYSVTQPRHFCRQCQRYWTAGGTLRNVPVGGGSRKKNRHAPRTGEPYLQQQQQRAHTAGQFAVPAPPGQHQQQQNVGFQQMMAQDQMVPLSFSGFYNNVPGYASLQDPAAYAYNQPELPPMHAMYGTGGGAPYYEMPVVPADNVKPELWTNMPPPPPPPLHQNTGSVLLNLGLNQRWDHQTGAAVMKPKHGSPPHGSSTLEEEGSTPTNGYSNSGYEEGDAVSSMWPSFQHDSDAMFQESMFQLSNPEDQR